MTVTAGTPIELVEGVYATLPGRVAAGRERFGRPLTLTEKILLNHLYDPTSSGPTTAPTVPPSTTLEMARPRACGG